MKHSQKLDLYAQHKAEYVTPKHPVLIHASPAQYLAISGHGTPGDPQFQKKLAALYNVAFTIKMASKFAGQDYAVSKLEGLWSQDGASHSSGQWNWTLLIRLPDFIGPKNLKDAIQKLREKGKDPEVEQVEIKKLKEGRSVQMLHVGPYDQEAPTIEAMRKFAADLGLAFRGLHHEIYLSDPRRVPPAKLRTILRYQVAALR
ncbi:MAG TPA: GyrI-like domain-containing protein [Gemmataceae bacterium]|jgi:hypothetical protein|nr:GyrI-like domain-containing protein [Gemmataceae bacterium]